MSAKKILSSFAKSILASNWLPVLLFGGFIVLAFFKEDILLWMHAYGITDVRNHLNITVGMGLWITGGFFVDRIIISVILDGIVGRAMNRSIPEILRTLIGVMIAFVVVGGVLSTVFHQSVAGLWATSGVAGIILGIALRPMILDVFSGLAVNMELIFKLGDWIQIDGGNKSATYSGWVHEISWRTTQLRNRDGDIVVFPNSFLASSVVINHSLPISKSRRALKVVVDPSVLSTRVKRILDAAVKAVINDETGPLPDPPPKVVISGYTHMGVEYTLLFWLNRETQASYTVDDLVLRAAHEYMNRAGITIAHPKQDVYLTKEFERSINIKLTEDRVRFLQNIELFEDLDQYQVLELAKKLKHHRCEQGKVLVACGDPGASMFVIIEGLLEVLSSSTLGGAEVKLGQLVPGQFFGEMSLLTGAPRSATVVAALDSVVFEVTKEDIKPLLMNNPDLVRNLSAIVASRQLKNVERMKEASQQEKQKQEEDFSHMLLSRIRRFFNM